MKGWQSSKAQTDGVVPPCDEETPRFRYPIKHPSFCESGEFQDKSVTSVNKYHAPTHVFLH